MKRTYCRGLTALLVLATLFPRAWADDEQTSKQRAQELLTEGNALLASGDNQQALAKFEQAHALFPSPALLLNIGTTLRALGRNAEAANTYARYIGTRQDSTKLEEVTRALAAVDRLVGVLTVVSRGANLVTVDGRPVARELGGVIRVEPGDHAVAATKPGFSPRRREISIAAGERQTVRLELEPVAGPSTTEPTATGPISPPADTSVDRSSNRPGRTLQIAGLSTAGAGVIAVALGIKFGLDASRLNDELEEEGQRLATNDEPWSQELFDKEDEGKSAETKMIVFTAIGAAAIATGGVLSYLGWSRNREHDRSLVVAPTVGPDSAGWAIAGEF